MAGMDHKDSSSEFVIALSLLLVGSFQKHLTICGKGFRSAEVRSASSHTEFSSLLMLNASVARKYYPSPSVYERTDGNVISVDAKRSHCAELLSGPSASERQDRNIITVGDKRCRCGEVLFQPKTSIRSRTFRCLRRTLPFRGTLVRHETGTSSLFAANASISRKSCFIPSFTGICSADSTTLLCRAR